MHRSSVARPKKCVPSAIASELHDQATTVTVEPLECRRLMAAGVPVFARTDLVSDMPAIPAQHTDPHLINAWGLAFNPAGVVWVGDNGTGVSTVYDTAGNLGSPVVAIPPPEGGTDGAAVTGVVFNNAGKAFNITGNGQTVPAEYVFVSEDGTIAGWHPVDGATAINVVDRSGDGAVYKGAAITGKGKKARLYAANFSDGTIEVFDSTFAPVALSAGAFADPTLPAGFAPFNVQTIGKKIYVTYAMQDSFGQDDLPGPGVGFVNVFDARGKLKQRLASGGVLNSPWAVVTGAGKFKANLLVGNFGDGTINVFTKKGKSLGPVTNESGQIISIPGLWGLAYGTIGSDKSKLFFAAGPNSESSGLLGVLTLTKTPSSSGTPTGGNGGGGPYSPPYNY